MAIRVKKLDSPRVSQGGAPAARVSSTAPEGTFSGLDAERQKQVIEQIGAQGDRNIQAQIAKAKQQADDAAIADADFKLSQLQNQAEAEASKLNGQDAANAPQVAADIFNAGADEIRASLKTDEQKLAFKRNYGSRYTSMSSSLEKQSSVKMQDYAVSTYDAALENESEMAARNYTEKDRREEALVNQANIFMKKADLLGWSPEQKIAEWNKIESKTHSAVIARMLSEGDVTLAKEYFLGDENNAGAIEGMTTKDSKEITKLIREGEKDNEVIVNAASIMEEAGNDLSVVDELISKSGAKDKKALRAQVKELRIQKEASWKQKIREIETDDLDPNKLFTLADLQKLKDDLDPAWVEAKRVAMKSPAESPEYEGKYDENALRLKGEYLEILNDSSSNSSRKFIDWVTKVHLAKSKITQEQYENLLKFGDQSFEDKVKGNGLIEALKATFANVVDYFKGNPESANNVINQVVAKAPEVANKEEFDEMKKEVIAKEREKVDPRNSKYEEGKIYNGFKAVRQPDGSIRMEEQ